MDSAEIIRLLFAALTGAGFWIGVSKLLTVKRTNEHIEALSEKTGMEAAAVFSDSVLRFLKQMEESAAEAHRHALEAMSAAKRAQDEVAFLRLWIQEQGLTPPIRLDKPA